MSCCVPAWALPLAWPGFEAPTPVASQPAASVSAPDSARPRLVHLPGGRFIMGSDAKEGFAGDGEGPAREVELSPFAIGETTVTNREFREFVRATHYITDAEQAGTSFVFYLQVDPQRRAAMRRISRELPWWLEVEGACWQRPQGPGSGIQDSLDHPVVHVSWTDATAYCAWAGLRLPTEARWEYAARGGLVQARYPWGNEFEPGGQRQCNTWQGVFPAQPQPGWTPGPMAARSFEANGYGLYQMVGNVWQWCADGFNPRYHQETALHDPRVDAATGQRAQRGGSFLCHDSYCDRYRVAARSSNAPMSATSHCGFRVAGDTPAR